DAMTDRRAEGIDPPAAAAHGEEAREHGYDRFDDAGPEQPVRDAMREAVVDPSCCAKQERGSGQAEEAHPSKLSAEEAPPRVDAQCCRGGDAQDEGSRGDSYLSVDPQLRPRDQEGA